VRRIRNFGRMFNLETWREIAQTLNNYRWRALLTAFGVFWGIFMLVILLAVGNGLQRGTLRMFGGLAQTSMGVWGGKASLPYKGMKPGRRIAPTVEDITAMKTGLPALKHISPQMSPNTEFTVTYDAFNTAATLFGLYPEFTYIQEVKIGRGRFINETDLQYRRKVVVIGTDIKKRLFKTIDPVGQYLKIKGIPFLVIGVLQPREVEFNVNNEGQRLYIPFSTFQQVFNRHNRVGYFMASAKEGFSGAELERQIKRYMSQRHIFDPEDPQAMGFDNTEKSVQELQGLFTAIRFFTWFVGIGTLLAGIVGVSNIMLISVKERTREIGIRKALGAKKWHILQMIILEAMVLTSLAGYVGLVSAVGLIELVRQQKFNSPYFSNPDINLEVALTAIGVLTLAGMIAGFVPARKAASVNPIEALRYE